jgi:hypothetical protein
VGKIIIENAVVRKSGFMYYIDGEGNICEAESHQTKIKNKKENK